MFANEHTEHVESDTESKIRNLQVLCSRLCITYEMYTSRSLSSEALGLSITTPFSVVNSFSIRLLTALVHVYHDCSRTLSWRPALDICLRVAALILL